MSSTKIELKRNDKGAIFGRAWTVKNEVGNIIIVPGMEEPSYRYEEFAIFLNQQGFNVYCLDLYGQGENVLPDKSNLGVWPKSGFRKMVQNIDLLVNKLRVSCRPTYIFAHSMGSFIVQDYIQRYTEHVSKVILCGSNGKQHGIGFAYFLSKLLVHKKNYQKKNGVSKFFTGLMFAGVNKKIKNKRTKFDWLSTDESVVDKYINDPLCGYGSTCSFYREVFKGMKRLHKRTFLSKIRKSLSIYIIGGKDDPIGKYGKGISRLARTYQKLGINNVDLSIYDGMRHEILNENGREIVYEDVLKFIKEDKFIRLVMNITDADFDFKELEKLRKKIESHNGQVLFVIPEKLYNKELKLNVKYYKEGKLSKTINDAIKEIHGNALISDFNTLSGMKMLKRFKRKYYCDTIIIKNGADPIKGLIHKTNKRALGKTRIVTFKEETRNQLRRAYTSPIFVIDSKRIDADIYDVLVFKKTK